MTEKIGFKVAYPAFKNSGQPDNDFGPQHSLKKSVWPDNDFGPQHSLNPIFSVIFGDNHKVSVLIGKPMIGGFQNTPNLKS